MTQLSVERRKNDMGMDKLGIGYESMGSKVIYDKLREYCMTERVDETCFRASARHKKQGREDASSKTRKDNNCVGQNENPTKKRGSKSAAIVITAMAVFLGGITLLQLGR
jgi:hypothetical protein